MKTCRSCVHLRKFELADDLFTCPVVNIRLHASIVRTFGCNYHSRKKRVRCRRK